MMYLREYKIEQKAIIHPFGKLIYRKVIPIMSRYPSKDPVLNSRTLYDDYLSTMDYPETFHHILLLEIDEKYRNNGYGKLLVQQFFLYAKPDSVILEAGITKQELYEEMEANNTIYRYIDESIKPFWVKMGFTDVNHTVFWKSELIPMLWPPERAARLAALSKTNLF